MFFLHEMQQSIAIHPSMMGPDIRNLLHNKLLADVEGKIHDDFYIVLVLDNIEIGDGRIIPSNCWIEYDIGYKAIVFKVGKGEVVDGTVSTVIKTGIFVEVGPMTAFISNHLIPSDIKFDANANPPQFSDHEGTVIERGTQMRIKITGIRIEATQMYAVATIKEDYLGALN